MSVMASQITSLTIVWSTVYSGADQRKLQSSASLAFVRGIHQWPVNSTHKGPVTRKMFPFDYVIMANSLRMIYISSAAWYGRVRISIRDFPSRDFTGFLADILLDPKATILRRESLMSCLVSGVWSPWSHFNINKTLRQQQNLRQFRDDIFKYIFVN